MAFKFDRSSRMTASPTVRVGISVCISAITAGASLPLATASASSSASRREDVLRRAEALRLRAVMIAQPALVAAHALGQVIHRLIEGGIGLVGGFLRMHQDAATDMHRDIGTEQMRLLREDDSRLDRVAEVFRDGVVKRLRDVGPQRLSDVDVFTFDCQIHVLCPTDGCNAAQLSSSAIRP